MHRQQIAEIKAAIHQGLQRFVGEQSNEAVISNMKQTILSIFQSYAGSDAEKLAFEITVEGSRCLIEPRNLFTALFFTDMKIDNEGGQNDLY